MKTFLEVVAQDIIDKYGYDLSRITIVFPNKRASIFLNEYLARMSDKPIWSPAYTTISDLFYTYSDFIVADQIKLICDLHKSFIKITGIDETLDHFYGWGQVLLSGFDDIDKNMAEPAKVFKNLADIHELDDISYLTEEQISTLKSFFNNFSEDKETELKQRFISLWNNFYNIYNDYNELLTTQEIAYEGAIYRKVVSDETVNFEQNTYIFVGFNVLQEVEQRLFSKLKEQSKAKFYWDFDKYYMDNTANEAGYYIKQYLSSFPNELDNHDEALYNNMLKDKNITYISTKTEHIQAGYIADWLRTGSKIEAGKRTAIVLCNESLLPNVLHSLPTEVSNVNITAGYPLSLLPINTLINALLLLQTAGYSATTDRYRLHYINPVLRHPYAKYVSSEAQKLVKHLNNDRVYSPVRNDLMTDDGLSILFDRLENVSQSEHNQALSQWILRVLQLIGNNIKDETDPLLQESIFRMYTLIQRVSNLISLGDLIVDFATFHRLLAQLIQSTTIPLHGEPAIGIQIMGVLETRNLDFDHVLVLSCNEGNMPKGINDTSFIPHSIRKAFGLTTIDNKVSIYSYYFHSLLQRATDVTLMYNTSTEDGNTGEMSRFMLQMMVESHYDIRRISLHTGQTVLVERVKQVVKDEQVMDILHNKTLRLSPTAINTYLHCPLMFYYKMVTNIKEPDEIDEDMMDNRVFGNIFHKAAEMIYRELIDKETVNATDINLLLKDKSKIERIVDEAFRTELFKSNDNKFVPTYNGIQIINRKVIIDYLRQLIKLDEHLTPFSLMGLEQEVSKNIEFNTTLGVQRIELYGRIDRMDRVVDDVNGERIRIIDYKTGRVTLTAIQSIEAIFDSNNVSTKHSDYYLQAFLYSLIVRKSHKLNSANIAVSPALLFVQRTSKSDYDPTLSIGKNDKVIDIANYADEFIAHLKSVLSEIFEPTKPFSPTTDIKRCSVCPYKQLCGVGN